MRAKGNDEGGGGIKREELWFPQALRPGHSFPVTIWSQDEWIQTPGTNATT